MKGYEVGYCRPPKHSQFKKGECPNPRGRGKRYDLRPMIVRVQVRLDRIDVDLSAERLVVRLLETNNSDSHSEQRDSMPRRAQDDSDAD